MDPATTPKRWVLITGCSNPDGIALRLCKLFLADGWGVFATARSLSKLEAAKAAGCETVVLDVCDMTSVGKAAETVAQKTGGELHCLINSAGVFGRGLALDTDLNKFRHVFDVNAFGPLALSQAFAPLLVRAAARNENAAPAAKPLIVNLGSICEVTGSHVSAYGASKAALLFISNNLRQEMFGLGVHVTHITLGSLRSESFVTGDSVLNMRRDAPDADRWPSTGNPVGRDETVYRNCRDELWDAEVKLTGVYHDAATDTEVTIAQGIYGAIKKGPPPILHLGYQAWQTKWIVPFLPRTTLDSTVVRLAGLDKAKRNADAAEWHGK